MEILWVVIQKSKDLLIDYRGKRMGLEVLIPFIPWLTWSWLWKNSIWIALISSTIYHWDKPHGFCSVASGCPF